MGAVAHTPIGRGCLAGKSPMLFMLQDSLIDSFVPCMQKDIVPVCRELGVGIVAYSPIGRGFLAGKYKSVEDIPEGDFRSTNPRFVKAAFEKVRNHCNTTFETENANLSKQLL